MERDVRRFLLGEMSEDERAAFEEMFVADEDLFERVRAGEDELIESYLRGTLRPGEKEIFERSFLTTERRRNRVEFTRAMLDKLAGQRKVAALKKPSAAREEAGPSVWNSIANFFKAPAVAFGTALALLILIFGGWFLWRNPHRAELARQITPTPVSPTTQPSANENLRASENAPATSNANDAGEIGVNKNALPENRNRETNKNQNLNERKQTTNGRASVLALFAGGVRGEGKTSELNLPQDAPGATLQLHLEQQDYKIYRVEIVDPDGNRIFRKNNLRATHSKINLFVPANKLARGDYRIKLSALNSQNEGESVADYTLRVNRK
jgi:hypothetical protein